MTSESNVDFCSWGSAAVHKAFRQCSCSLWCQKCNPLSELYRFVFMPGHLITLRFIDRPVASTNWWVFKAWAAIFFSSPRISGKGKVPGLKSDVMTVWEECEKFRPVPSDPNNCLWQPVPFFFQMLTTLVKAGIIFLRLNLPVLFQKYSRNFFCLSQALYCLKYSTFKQTALNFLSLLSSSPV